MRRQSSTTTTVLLALALLASHVVRLNAQKGAGTAGQTTSTSCTAPLGGPCAQNGTSNYVSRNLTYNANTGKFTGTMTFNQVGLPQLYFCALPFWWHFVTAPSTLIFSTLFNSAATITLAYTTALWARPRRPLSRASSRPFPLKLTLHRPQKIVELSGLRCGVSTFTVWAASLLLSAAFRVKSEGGREAKSGRLRVIKREEAGTKMTGIRLQLVSTKQQAQPMAVE